MSQYLPSTGRLQTLDVGERNKQFQRYVYIETYSFKLWAWDTDNRENAKGWQETRVPGSKIYIEAAFT